jgi:hypothetical protein
VFKRRIIIDSSPTQKFSGGLFPNRLHRGVDAIQIDGRELQNVHVVSRTRVLVEGQGALDSIEITDLLAGERSCKLASSIWVAEARASANDLKSIWADP